MSEADTQKQYREYIKPSWAPPAWVFGPVWSVLYLIIAISFGYVGYFFLVGAISGIVALPFLLNLVANVAYTPLQFRWRNFKLATVDIVLVLVTLIWAMAAIHPYASWISIVNIPYLAWVCFASGLQITVMFLNMVHKRVE
jgi:tryptophan-rich sensory protein